MNVAELRRRFRPSEKEVQVRVIRTYEAYGGIVYSLSQPRATMQSAGFGDLYVFLPRQRRAVWHETKRPGGRIRPGQIQFQQLCAAAGQDYVIGGVDEALAYLRSIGTDVVLKPSGAS